MLEHIMGTGTYTGSGRCDCYIDSVSETTLGFAAIVIFLDAIVAHSALLRKYAIPAPVISVSSFLLLYLSSRVPESSVFFDAKIEKTCQNLFFLCVGFSHTRC